jgi:hypothetical protein
MLNDKRVRLGRRTLAGRRIGQVREFVRIIVTTTETRFVREGEGLRYKSTWQTLQPRYACTRAQRRFAGESQKVSCDLTREGLRRQDDFLGRIVVGEWASAQLLAKTLAHLHRR